MENSIPFGLNSPVVVNSERDSGASVVSAENERSQEINVYAGSVVPELPKVLDNEQINVYAPIAGENFPGLAFFNPNHFHIALNGFVSLLKGGIEKIEKIKNQDGIDTWGIFLTDGRIEYFTIQNGKAGPAGYTPVKGIDYYTSAEKSEIIDEIISKIPFAEGMSV